MYGIKVYLRFYDGDSGEYRAYTPPDAPRSTVWGENMNEASAKIDPTRTLQQIKRDIRRAYNLPNVPTVLGLGRRLGDTRPLSDGFGSGDVISVFLNPIE